MTPQEKLILQFLLTILVVGLIVGYARRFWFSDSLGDLDEAKAMGDKVATIAEERHAQYTADLTADQSTHPAQQDASSKININKASKIELMSLPGIGPALAERIILYREDYGEFRSVDDLMNVKGVGSKNLEKLRNLISI